MITITVGYIQEGGQKACDARYVQNSVDHWKFGIQQADWKEGFKKQQVRVRYKCLLSNRIFGWLYTRVRA
jgi:hypothetical protein